MLSGWYCLVLVWGERDNQVTGGLPLKTSTNNLQKYGAGVIYHFGDRS